MFEMKGGPGFHASVERGRIRHGLRTRIGLRRRRYALAGYTAPCPAVEASRTASPTESSSTTAQTASGAVRPARSRISRWAIRRTAAAALEPDRLLAGVSMSLTWAKPMIRRIGLDARETEGVIATMDAQLAFEERLVEEAGRRARASRPRSSSLERGPAVRARCAPRARGSGRPLQAIGAHGGDRRHWPRARRGRSRPGRRTRTPGSMHRRSAPAADHHAAGVQVAVDERLAVGEEAVLEDGHLGAQPRSARSRRDRRRRALGRASCARARR